MCELNGVQVTNEGFFCILGGILKVFSKILESLTSKIDVIVCLQSLSFPKGFEYMCFDCVWGIEPKF